MKMMVKSLLPFITVVLLIGSWSSALASDKPLKCVESAEKAEALILYAFPGYRIPYQDANQ